jgi:hypothetical protein
MGIESAWAPLLECRVRHIGLAPSSNSKRLIGSSDTRILVSNFCVRK